jgi:hypothetical protein
MAEGFCKLCGRKIVPSVIVERMEQTMMIGVVGIYVRSAG